MLTNNLKELINEVKEEKRRATDEQFGAGGGKSYMSGKSKKIAKS